MLYLTKQSHEMHFPFLEIEKLVVRNHLPLPVLLLVMLSLQLIMFLFFRRYLVLNLRARESEYCYKPWHARATPRMLKQRYFSLLQVNLLEHVHVHFPSPI